MTWDIPVNEASALHDPDPAHKAGLGPPPAGTAPGMSSFPHRIASSQVHASDVAKSMHLFASTLKMQQRTWLLPFARQPTTRPQTGR